MSCAGPGIPPADQLPFSWTETVGDLQPSTSVDLDGDGRDDFVMAENRGGYGGGGVVSLLNDDRHLIDQFQIEGRTLPAMALDINDDARREVFMPFVRNDSLFVSVGDAHGNKLFNFFLIEGAPRVEPDGILPWDPHIHRMEIWPGPADSGPRLVTLINTGLARVPRGILVHDLSTGERVGEWLTGAPLVQPHPIDINGDDSPEWFFTTSTSDNGADVGGQTDRESYALMVQVTPSPALLWSRRLGGLPSAGWGAAVDTDGDGSPEPLVFVSASDSSRVEILDPLTGGVRSIRFRPGLTYALAIDPVAGQQARFVGRNADLELELVDLEGTTIKRTPAGIDFGPVTYTTDFDGDGRRELIANIGRNTLVLLDEGLKILAAGGQGYVNYQVPLDIVANRDEPPRIRLPKTRTESGHIELRLEPNPWWLWNRAEPWAMPIGLGLLFAGLSGGLLHYRRLAGEQSTGAGDPDSNVWRITSRQIAHDFKGPLNRVQGRLDHMQLEYADAEPTLVQKLDAQRAGIQDQIRTLTRRTDNFLKFVDVVEPTRGLVELNEVVRESLSSFEPVRARGIDLELALEDQPLEVYADRDQLHSVIENLVQNAVDAVDARGKITVATRLAPGLHFEPSPTPVDFVVLEVRDTGQGMSAEVQFRMFEAGFSGTSRSSGLGLAIVKKIVTDQGGRIDVDTEAHIGTVFTIYLPAA